MANKYSSNYQAAYVDVPASKIPPGEQSGDVKTMYAEYVADGELAVADVLYLGKLPKGARVVGGRIICPASGITGIFDVGYLANGVDAADADAFVVAADPGAAAVSADIAGAGLGKKFEAETTVVLDPSEVTAALNGLTIKFWLHYVIV